MRILSVIIFIGISALGYAKDYGVLGQTYEIAEQDFLEYIEAKINRMQSNGQWHQLEEQFTQQVKKKVERPTPVALSKAQESRTFLYNPSIVAPFDVHDNQGHLIVSKGTVINPLDRIQLSSTLLFFNADDPEQLDWAIAESKLHSKIKLILTSGSIKSTTRLFKQAAFFDLNGFLTTKFGIQAVPAVLTQSGKRLQISEVKL